MRLNRKERAQRRQRSQEALDAYRATHSPQETHRHVRARYPSGRPSHGGANRSSDIRREIGLHVTHVTLCTACGGVTPEVFALTALFPLCSCVT